MERTIVYIEPLNEKIKWIAQVLLGCGLITLGSLVKIPLYPVSFTMQTLAIYILALTLTPKQAFASTLCYLLCATVGLPVLCGHANLLWILGKSSGYLVAFPFAAYCMAHLRQKQSAILSLLCGMALIFTLGFLGLIPFFGIKTALVKGVLIFIPSEILKALASIAATQGEKR
jgi:biotin transport system substrate-specific component